MFGIIFNSIYSNSKVGCYFILLNLNKMGKTEKKIKTLFLFFFLQSLYTRRPMLCFWSCDHSDRKNCSTKDRRKSFTRHLRVFFFGSFGGSVAKRCRV